MTEEIRKSFIINILKEKGIEKYFDSNIIKNYIK